MRPPRGSTVTELLVGLVLSLVVLGAAAGALRAASLAARHFAEAADRHDGLRIALDLLSRQVRLAGYDPELAGIAPLVAAGPHAITIQRDLDADGSVNAGSRERTGFRRAADGTRLLSLVGHQATPILASLRDEGFALRYLGAGPRWTTRPVAAALRSVRQVGFRIVAGSPGSSAREVISSSVALRNRPEGPP